MIHSGIALCSVVPLPYVKSFLGLCPYFQAYLQGAILNKTYSALNGVSLGYTFDGLGAITMDSSGGLNDQVAFEDVLVDQASRFGAQLPHFSGLLIDRLSITELYNINGDADDGAFVL